MIARLWRPVQALFLLLAFLFIALLLRSQWAELSAYPWRLHSGWLAGSALLIGLSWLCEVFIWRSILGLMGGPLPFLAALRIWFLSALVRYIPGNVWQPLGMTVLCQRRQIRPETTISSIALFQALNLLTVGVIAAAYLPAGGHLGVLDKLIRPPFDRLLLAAAFPLVVFLLRPQWLVALLNAALVRIGRTPLTAQVSSRALLELALVTLLDWLLLGAGFAALLPGLGMANAAEVPALLPHLTGSYPVAYALGYLSFVTPSGLAVREGALYLLLEPVLDGGGAAAAALAMRLWLTICELAAVGLVWLFSRNIEGQALTRGLDQDQVRTHGETG